MNEEELRQMLDKLRADYAEQLPGTIAEMEELWRGIAAAEIPLSQLEKLMRMAHSMTAKPIRANSPWRFKKKKPS